VKNTIIPDIYHLGYSLVNKVPSKEVDKAFVVKDSAFPNLNTDEIQELLQAVTSLSKKVNSLQVQVTTLSSDNKSLHNEVKRVQEEMTHLKAEVTSSSSHGGTNLDTNPSESSRAQNHSTVVHEIASNPSTSSDVDSSDSEGMSADIRDDLAGFVLPSHHKRRLSKQERRALKRAPKQKNGGPATVVKQRNANQTTPSEVTEGAPPSHQTTVKTTVKSAQLQTASNSGVSRDHTMLSAAPNTEVRRAEIYIGGLDAKHGITDIKNHLSKHCVASTGVKILSTRREWRSFVVTVAKSDMDKVMDPALWPNGVTIRPFHAQQSHSRSQQNTTHARHSNRQDHFRSNNSRHRSSYGHGYQRPSHSRHNHHSSWRRNSYWDDDSYHSRSTNYRDNSY